MLACNKYARNVFGMHGTQLHGNQLSSYKLQVWLIFLAIINSVMQVGSPGTMFTIGGLLFDLL